MKIRTGFVSNSSSSSFVLDKYFITPDQLDKLLNPNLDDVKQLYEDFLEGEDLKDFPFEEWCHNKFGWIENVNGWSIKNKIRKIEFDTDLDNFQYDEYALLLGIDKRAFISRVGD